MVFVQTMDEYYMKGRRFNIIGSFSICPNTHSPFTLNRVVMVSRAVGKPFLVVFDKARHKSDRYSHKSQGVWVECETP